MWFLCSQRYTCLGELVISPHLDLQLSNPLPHLCHGCHAVGLPQPHRHHLLFALRCQTHGVSASATARGTTGLSKGRVRIRQDPARGYAMPLLKAPRASNMSQSCRNHPDSAAWKFICVSLGYSSSTHIRAASSPCLSCWVQVYTGGGVFKAGREAQM